MAHSKYMQIAYDVEFDPHYDLIEIKKYYSDSLRVCEMIEQHGVEKVRDMVDESEIVIPKPPKISLKKLIIDVPKSKSSPEKLFKFLSKLLVSDLKFCDTVYPNEHDKSGVYKFLRCANSTVQNSQAKTFYLSGMFGHFLDVFYNNFYKNLDEKPWHVYIKEHFGINDRQGRSLRSIGRLMKKYPRFRLLSITVKDFLKLMKPIEEMLKEERFNQFWSSAELVPQASHS